MAKKITSYHKTMICEFGLQMSTLYSLLPISFNNEFILLAYYHKQT